MHRWQSQLAKNQLKTTAVITIVEVIPEGVSLHRILIAKSKSTGR